MLLREACLCEQPRMDLVRGLVEKGASPDMQVRSGVVLVYTEDAAKTTHSVCQLRL